MRNFSRIQSAKIFVIIFTLFPYFSLSQDSNDKQALQKFTTAMQIIRYAYVDSVNEPELIEKAIVETLKELDPHSRYISREKVAEANEPLEGSFEGIGVTFQIHEDTILVISAVPGGPSDRIGIMAGDKIVKIGGKNATGPEIDNDFVKENLRGHKGTEVDVSIFRQGIGRLIDFTILRDKIPLHSVEASFMATPEIGYIKLNKFSRTSVSEFRSSIRDLKDEGMDKLILDLRGNSGGYLDVAVDIADEFLNKGKVIVYTQGSYYSRKNYTSTFRGGFEEEPLVILIDEGSASASEIVAGAVQDWDRGLVIGRRSFGKGLVQRPFQLPDSSVIRLTTARYYTPSGRCIQKPYNEGTDEYHKEISERLESGELAHADSIAFPDSLLFYTKSHRVVYGGGGIMPDIFVPYDSTKYSDYYIDLRRTGAFNDFVLNILEKNRKQYLGEYSRFEKFNKKFEVSESMIDDLVELAEEKEVEFDEEGFLKSEALIKYQVKAMIARNLWSVNEYYRVISEINDGFQKAIEVLENEDNFDEHGISMHHK